MGVIIKPITDAIEKQDWKTVYGFCNYLLKAWDKSPKRKEMLLGEDYFRNKVKILDKIRTVIGADGQMVESPHLSNTQLVHGYMRKLTKQKVGYLLSKPFTAATEDDGFQESLDSYFNDTFYSIFKDCAQDSIIYGIAWLLPYYDTESNLGFQKLPSLEVVPVWEDASNTNLLAAVREYNEMTYTGSGVENVKKVQLYLPTGIYTFTTPESGMFENVAAPTVQPYFSVKVVDEETQEETLAGATWGGVPLIPVRYTAEESSLVVRIKTLVDDYDLLTSGTSDMFQDEPNRIKVVKDYDGTDKGEFVRNLALYRTLFIRGTGSVETLNNYSETISIEKHLERLRKDIFEFGGGIDTQDKNLADASGVSLKFIYADLDQDCGEFSIELSKSLQTITNFIRKDLEWQLGKTYEDKVTFIFNTDIIISEVETVENLKNSVGILSQETLREQHPYVRNPLQESERVRREAEEERQQLKEDAYELQRTQLKKQSTT